MPIRWHEEDPDLLREAIAFTRAETGFSARLIEKDYFCSVLLEYLASSSEELTFKGGTCLSKIHAGFYRLSEDLDFSISTASDSTRTMRRESIGSMRTALSGLDKRLPSFRVKDALTGANNSTQYNALVGYTSLLGPDPESIRVEIGLREPLLTEPVRGRARTAVLHPISGLALVDVHPVRCLSYPELMAEKLRAAVSRLDVAIRDFFDIDHAVRNGLDIHDTDLLGLLRRKLAVPGTGPLDVSPERVAQLRRQLDGELRPVLQEHEFANFDLERAIRLVSDVALEVRRPG